MDSDDGLIDSPPSRKHAPVHKKRNVVASDSEEESHSPSTHEENNFFESMGSPDSLANLDQFAYDDGSGGGGGCKRSGTGATEHPALKPAFDTGWMSKGQSDPDPDYGGRRGSTKKSKGKRPAPLARGGGGGGGKRGDGGGGQGGKRKTTKKVDSDEESTDYDSEDEDEDEEEEEKEVIELSDDEDEGHGDSQDEEDAVFANSDEENEDEDPLSALSRAAQEKLASCRRISDKLRAALGRWEVTSAAASSSSGPPEEEESADQGGVLNMTAMAGQPSRDKGGGGGGDSARHKGGSGGGSEWQPVDERVIEAQCTGLKAIKPYQCVGVNWLLLLHHQGVSGVLADDMGLGKTVQTIAFFAMLKRNAELRGRRSSQSTSQSQQCEVPTHLVVVPASVLSNWQGELSRFAPHLNVVIYHGSPAARAEAKSKVRRAFNGLGSDSDLVDVVVTTYTYFERESSGDDRKFFRSVDWDYMVLDEAHGVKNMKTARWQHLRNLKTTQKLLLSGTPVQNNLRELLVLLDFLSPDVFRFNWSRGGGRGGWDDGDKGDPIGELLLGLGLNEDGKVSEDTTMSSSVSSKGKGSKGKGKGVSACVGTQRAAVRQIRTMLAPFVLRRLKSQVLTQLAPKTTTVVSLKPMPKQQTLYDDILRRHVQKLKSAASAASASGSKAPSASKKKKAGKGVMSVTVVVDDSEDDESGGSTSSAAAAAQKKGGGGFGGEGAVMDEVEVVAIGGSSSNGSGCASSSSSTVVSTAAVVERVVSDRDAKNVFVELRKAANHPLLLREHFRVEAKMKLMTSRLHANGHFGDLCTCAMVRKELEGYSDLDLHQLCVDYGGSLQHLELPSECLFDSAKMTWLREHVPRLISEGHRVLIFSQWTKLLDVLELLLHHLAIAFCRLDGSTPVPTRQALIDDFNTDKNKNVFLLSTRAGGLGINLTSADTVIMHDLDFNPVTDAQAEDRCHRIGQTKPVGVYKLVTDGTVDARILELGEQKTVVNKTLLDSDAGGGAENSSSSAASSASGPPSMSSMLKDALKSFLS